MKEEEKNRGTEGRRDGERIGGGGVLEEDNIAFMLS